MGSSTVAEALRELGLFSLEKAWRALSIHVLVGGIKLTEPDFPC